MTEIKIECPKCEWEPDGGPHWMCSCRHRWNTFDTQGVCPNCKKRWKDTQCIKCFEWSPHEDWYIIPLNVEELAKEKQETFTE